MTWVVRKESDAIPMIRAVVASGTEVHADESNAWNLLHASYPMKRVNHSIEFSAEDGSCTNQAESFFSAVRPRDSVPLAQACALAPRDVRSRVYYAASFLNRSWLHPIRATRHSMRRAGLLAPLEEVPQNLLHDTVYR